MYDFLDKIGLKAVLEAIKGKMPTSLPANGGNADTVDGHHAHDFAKSTSPRINGDMVFLSDTNQNTISAIYSANDCLVFRNYTKDWSSICDVVIDNNGVRIANATQNFIVGNGGNADTVDGFHADDFAKARNSDLMTLLNGQSGDIRALVHQLSNGGYVFNTEYPQLKDIIFPITGAGNLSWSTGIFNINGYRYGILIARPMTYNGDTYICSVYNNGAYTDWQKIYTDWNKPYVTGSVTVAANATTAITNHNFMPSAALYLGILNNVRFAPSFTTTSISLADVQTTERTIEYIIFK